MALRYSYRISSEALSNGAQQQPGQSAERGRDTEETDIDPRPQHTRASMQKTAASCIDLLTSF